MIKKALLIGGSALLLPTMAQADTLFGIYAGANAWFTGASGDVNYQNLGLVDVEDQLQVDDETNAFYYVAVEHFVPLIPNIKLQRTDLKLEGSNPDGEFNFLGIPFDADVESTIDLTHNDATLYYELLDNWVSLDLGLTVRMFDGEISATGESGGNTVSDTVDIDLVLPMLYGKARFDLPLSGLSFEVNGNFIGYEDNNLMDMTATLNYEFAFGLGVAAGYRSFSAELDDIDDLDADVVLDGAFAGLSYHF
jgi:outer membrane protein